MIIHRVLKTFILNRPFTAATNGMKFGADAEANATVATPNVKREQINCFATWARALLLHGSSDISSPAVHSAFAKISGHYSQFCEAST